MDTIRGEEIYEHFPKTELNEGALREFMKSKLGYTDSRLEEALGLQSIAEESE